jgi:hypothetical protein
VKYSIGGIDTFAEAKHHGSARVPKRRRPSAGQPPAAPPRGLPTAELLAKIDELDWEDTCPPLPPAVVAPAVVINTPPRRPSWLIPLLIAGLVLVSVGLLAFYQGWATDVPSRPTTTANQAVVVSAAGPAEASPGGGAAEDDAARLAAVEAQERQRVAKLSQAVRQAEENALRKADKLRKAREEEVARQEQEQQERRRQEEEARQRAEREAAEARAKAQVPPQPKGPASPQELCADRSNFFTRGLCEAEICGQPEWLKHPFCVKRMEDQLRRVGGGH